MSHRLSRFLAAVVRGATRFQSPGRRVITRAMVSEAVDAEVRMPLDEGDLVFACPTGRAAHDPLNLFKDEPETLRWLDQLPGGAVLWDIGANVGTYALYGARRRRLHVLAFEPSAATYGVLCENLHRNRLDLQIAAYCLAFSDRTGLDRLYMGNAAAGGSMHAFGSPETVTGRLEAPLTQAVPGFTIDRFMELFAPPPPAHIKLDVDSIEDRILAGGRETLRRHTESVLVEIDGTAREEGGGAIRTVLTECGFAEDRDFARPGDRRNVLFRRRR